MNRVSHDGSFRGQRTIARHLDATTDHSRFVLQKKNDKKTLENATGFDKKDWPDFVDPNFGERNDKHFPRAVSITVERK